MSTNSTAESYDAAPYPSLCYTQTTPNRLATIATLLGMSPAPVARCRVLELGTASGGNIIPLAALYPESTFVGVDYAARQIAAGQADVAALGLENVTLIHADIRALGNSLGEFDYVIAHGVYSWSPPDVREALLALCRRSLAPQGVAFVSYNALPGWHMLLAVREMMQYHTRDVEAPLEKARAAREFVQALSAIGSPDGVLNSYLQAYGNMLALRWEVAESDALLLHDELEEINQPFYFQEFVSHAHGHDLQYLAEADFPQVMLSNFKPEAAQQVAAWAGRDGIALEQYMDFVRFRTLRQTLLVHKDVAIRRQFSADPELARPFHFLTRARIERDGSGLDTREPLTLVTGDGGRLTSDHPVSKAALVLLATAAPAAVAFDELLAAARHMVGAADEHAAVDARQLTMTLLRGLTYSFQLIEPQLGSAPFATVLSNRPVASPVARLQISQGLPRVTNLRHERVKLDDLGRFLLARLDGAHSMEALLTELGQLAADGMLVLKGGVQVSSEDAHAALRQDLEQSLRFLLQAALLTA